MKKLTSVLVSVSLLLCQLFVSAPAVLASDVPYGSFNFDDYTGSTDTMIPDSYEYVKSDDYEIRFRSKYLNGYGHTMIREKDSNKYLEVYGTGNYQNNYISIQPFKNKSAFKINSPIQMSFKFNRQSLHDHVAKGGFLRMHLTNGIDGKYNQIGNFMTFDTSGNMQLGNGNEMKTFSYDIKKWYDVRVTMDFNPGKIKFYVAESDNPSEFVTASFDHAFTNVGVIYLGFGVGVTYIDDIVIEEPEVFRMTSSSVADGAYGIGVNPKLEFTFSSPLDENSIPSVDIDGDTSKIDEVSADGNKLNITLNSALDFNTKYILNISGIKSMIGDELDKSISFTTGSEAECFASTDRSGKKVTVLFTLPGSISNQKINSYRKNETDYTCIPYNLMITKKDDTTPVLIYNDYVDGTMSGNLTLAVPTECDSGIYEVSIKTDKTVKTSAQFKYINADTAKEAFSKLDSGEKLGDVIEEFYEELGMSAEDAQISADCEKYFADYVSDKYVDLPTFLSAYENAVLKSVLVSEFSDEEKLLAVYDAQLSSGIDYYDFASKSSAEREYCYNALRSGYNKADTLSEEINLNLITYEINGSNEYTWEKYADIILNKYSDVIKIDTSDYDKLGYKSKVINEVKKKEYSELSDIVSAFEMAVSKQLADEKSQQSSNSGTSSSGGGGFGGGSSSGPVLDVNIGNEYAGTQPSVSKSFSDVPSSHWAYEAISSLASKGYVSGRDGLIFDPDSTIKRGEFAKIIASVFSAKPAGGMISFSDVSENSWYHDSVIALAELGIILGDTNGNFNPEMNITRQDMAVIVQRVCNVFGIKLNTSDKSVLFADESSIDGYAKKSVEALSSCGIINGMPDGSFNPLGTLTRAQGCKVIYEITK